MTFHYDSDDLGYELGYDLTSTTPATESLKLDGEEVRGKYSMDPAPPVRPTPPAPPPTSPAPAAPPPAATPADGDKPVGIGGGTPLPINLPFPKISSAKPDQKAPAPKGVSASPPAAPGAPTANPLPPPPRPGLPAMSTDQINIKANLEKSGGVSSAVTNAKTNEEKVVVYLQEKGMPEVQVKAFLNTFPPSGPKREEALAQYLPAKTPLKPGQPDSRPENRRLENLTPEQINQTTRERILKNAIQNARDSKLTPLSLYQHLVTHGVLKKKTKDGSNVDLNQPESNEWKSEEAKVAGWMGSLSADLSDDKLNEKSKMPAYRTGNAKLTTDSVWADRKQAVRQRYFIEEEVSAPNPTLNLANVTGLSVREEKLKQTLAELYAFDTSGKNNIQEKVNVFMSVAPDDLGQRMDWLKSTQEKLETYKKTIPQDSAVRAAGGWNVSKDLQRVLDDDLSQRRFNTYKSLGIQSVNTIEGHRAHLEKLPPEERALNVKSLEAIDVSQKYFPGISNNDFSAGFGRREGTNGSARPATAGELDLELGRLNAIRELNETLKAAGYNDPIQRRKIRESLRFESQGKAVSLSDAKPEDIKQWAQKIEISTPEQRERFLGNEAFKKWTDDYAAEHRLSKDIAKSQIIEKYGLKVDADGDTHLKDVQEAKQRMKNELSLLSQQKSRAVGSKLSPKFVDAYVARYNDPKKAKADPLFKGPLDAEKVREKFARETVQPAWDELISRGNTPQEAADYLAKAKGWPLKKNGKGEYVSIKNGKEVPVGSKESPTIDLSRVKTDDDLVRFDEDSKEILKSQMSPGELRLASQRAAVEEKFKAAKPHPEWREEAEAHLKAKSSSKMDPARLDAELFDKNGKPKTISQAIVREFGNDIGAASRGELSFDEFFKHTEQRLENADAYTRVEVKKLMSGAFANVAENQLTTPPLSYSKDKATALLIAKGILQSDGSPNTNCDLSQMRTVANEINQSRAKVSAFGDLEEVQSEEYKGPAKALHTLITDRAKKKFEGIALYQQQRTAAKNLANPDLQLDPRIRARLLGAFAGEPSAVLQKDPTALEKLNHLNSRIREAEGNKAAMTALGKELHDEAMKIDPTLELDTFGRQLLNLSETEAEIEHLRKDPKSPHNKTPTQGGVNMDPILQHQNSRDSINDQLDASMKNIHDREAADEQFLYAQVKDMRDFALRSKQHEDQIKMQKEQAMMQFIQAMIQTMQQNSPMSQIGALWQGLQGQFSMAQAIIGRGGGGGGRRG